MKWWPASKLALGSHRWRPMYFKSYRLMGETTTSGYEHGSTALNNAPQGSPWSFFVLGLLVVAAYAWQRFNEPSFPNQKALPHTLVPLQYLFLKPAYQQA